ncbi:MAG: hypothetical protein ABH828_06310 [archaeon]
MNSNFVEELAEKVPYLKIESVEEGKFKLENGSILQIVYDTKNGLELFLNEQPIAGIKFDNPAAISIDGLAKSLMIIKDRIYEKSKLQTENTVPVYTTDMNAYEKTMMDKHLKQVMENGKNPDIVKNLDKNHSITYLNNIMNETKRITSKEYFVNMILKHIPDLIVDFENEPYVAHYDAKTVNDLYDTMINRCINNKLNHVLN